MKTHKAITKTQAGEITTWIVSDVSYLTFRIVAFRMDANYAKKNNNGHQIYELNVEAFDPESFGWKTIIKNNDFSDEDVKAMLDSDNILEEIKDFLQTFFGIRMYNDANTNESLPF